MYFFNIPQIRMCLYTLRHDKLLMWRVKYVFVRGNTVVFCPYCRSTFFCLLMSLWKYLSKVLKQKLEVVFSVEIPFFNSLLLKRTHNPKTECSTKYTFRYLFKFSMPPPWRCCKYSVMFKKSNCSEDLLKDEWKQIFLVIKTAPDRFNLPHKKS